MVQRLHRKSGFTIIEILVSIGIIAVLGTMATFSSLRARVAAREAGAKEDLSSIRNGIALLMHDTGKWPNGCPVEDVSNPEVQLSDGQAGLLAAPEVGDQGDGCFWTAGDVASWDGPYVQFSDDPWDEEYYFDPDYRPWENCGSKSALSERPAIVSFGPNGVGLNAYDCDDIWLALH